MTQKPEFEHEDGEKIARLIAYIPAMLHVQNLIKLDTPYGREIGKHRDIYNDAVEHAAGQFLRAVTEDEEINLPLDA
jgi:hypothetical protein